jgi:hypothetical protein
MMNTLLAWVRLIPTAPALNGRQSRAEVSIKNEAHASVHVAFKETKCTGRRSAYRILSKNTVVGGSFWKSFNALARCFIGMLRRARKKRTGRRTHRSERVPGPAATTYRKGLSPRANYLLSGERPELKAVTR